MKFNTLAYERSKGDNYNRQTLKIEVTVAEGQDHDATLDWLQARVERDLRISHEKAEKDIVELQSQIRQLEREKEYLQQQISEAQKRWDAASAFLKQHGVSLSSDNIPF